MNRRQVLLGAGTAFALVAGIGWVKTRKKPVPIGFDVDEAEIAKARAFLQDNPAIDIHAHPGRTFVRGAKGLKGKMRLYQALGTFEDKTVADMIKGGVGAASFSSVSDFQVLTLGKKGLHAARPFKPGEAWQSFQRQYKNMMDLEAKGLVTFVGNEAQLVEAHKNGKVAAIFMAEGSDFLGGQPERIADVAQKGLQSITLMHYRTNGVGDIMTQNPVHGGLTEIGKSVVREMNRSHILIDLAHASEATAFDALKISTTPVMCSHTHILGANVPKIPRFISLDLAKAITDAGGIIGAWPAGLGIEDLNGYIDRIFELVDALGIESVAMGTDMDANYKPVFETYTKMPILVAGLQKRGMGDEDLKKFVRGNFLRVWGQA